MALMCNISQQQIQKLGAFFATLQKMNEAHDYIKTRGQNARGAAENLTAAQAAYDAAISAAAEAFGEGK